MTLRPILGRPARTQLLPAAGLIPPLGRSGQNSWLPDPARKPLIVPITRLAEIAASKPVHRGDLVLEAHYHGDTALCAFGPGREHLLAYRAALARDDWPRLLELFGDAVIELSEADAGRYAANSFTLTHAGESFLFMPGGVSDRLLDQIRQSGVTPITVGVSEFLKKGGGSVKLMIGDLGSHPEPTDTSRVGARLYRPGIATRRLRGARGRRRPPCPYS